MEFRQITQALQQAKPLLIMGRAGMDFYPEPIGTKTKDASSFQAGLGGSAGNIAVGICKLGGKASLMTAFSEDPVGDFCRAQLKRYGVGSELVVTTKGEARTSLAVSESVLEGHQTVIYRNDAADFQVTSQQVSEIAFSAYSSLVLTGTNFAKQPSRDAHLKAMAQARAAGIPIILDIDYRPYSWANAQEASEVLTQVCKGSDGVVGNDEEFDFVAGAPGLGLTCANDLAKNCAFVVYKRGAEGALTLAGKQRIDTGIFKVEALKPVGSGDAFLSSMLASLHQGNTLETAITRGSASAAIVVGKVGCSLAMPNAQELDTFIATHPGMT